MEKNLNKRNQEKFNYQKKIPFNSDKIPPHSIDLEESILGSCIINYEALHKVLKIFHSSDYFYVDNHKKIYQAILDITKNKDPIDMMIICRKLKENGDMDHVGNPIVIAKLCNKALPCNVEVHARIVYQLYLRREIIRIAYNHSNNAYADNEDVFDILVQFENDIKEISAFKNESKIIRNKDISLLLINDLELVEAGEKGLFVNQYPIGDPKFDKYIGIRGDKILLISGGSKYGKSKYTRYLMFKLLNKYKDNVAIDWVTLEDSAKDIGRCYLSNHFLIKKKDIETRNYDKNLNHAMIDMYSDFSNFDIEYTEIRGPINSFINHFQYFVKKRPNKLNILIIDNILSLEDIYAYKNDPVGFADYTMGELLKCRQETNGLIIPIHHYKDAQQHKDNLINGYRPLLTDLKGSEAYRRVPNQVLLINNPGKQKDLVADYPDNLKNVVKSLFIVDAGANREDNNDDDTIIRYLHSLDYEIFEEF